MPKSVQTPSKTQVRRTFTDEELANAVARWKSGEPLSQIANEYHADYRTLIRLTRAARADVLYNPQRVVLSDEQITAAVIRWQGGEPIDHIARDYQISSDVLFRQTREARKSLPVRSLRILNDAEIAQAVASLKSGQPLKQVAANMGVSYSTIVLHTRHARIRQGKKSTSSTRLSAKQAVAIKQLLRNKAVLADLAECFASLSKISTEQFSKISGPSSGKHLRLHPDDFADILKRLELGQTIKHIAGIYSLSAKVLTHQIKQMHIPTPYADQPILSSKEIINATLRWGAGASLTTLANAYSTNKTIMEHAMMFVCWKSGMPSEEIAGKFKRTKAATLTALRKANTQTT